MKDWKVTKYGKMPHKGGYYQYWVEGFHQQDGSPFFWVVPDIKDKRYDFSGAIWCDNVKEYNLEKRVIIL